LRIKEQETYLTLQEHDDDNRKVGSVGVTVFNTNPIKSFHKGKGKAVPLQAWSGPEVSRKLRFPYFMTTAQDCGKFVSPTHRPHLPPGNTPGAYFC
jgi:hypothetical protein